jgi:hypothetical protein
MPDDDQKLSYERIPLRRKADAPARGVKVPNDVIRKLGTDDVPGACILADVLHMHPLHGGVVGVETLAALGDGDVKVGKAVLRSFITHVRRQAVSQIHSKQ